jgi:hypothetical protein
MNCFCENVPKQFDLLISSKLDHVKFLNFHGQEGARLSRDQTVHERTYHKSSLLMAFMSPLLFNAPEGYFTLLESLYVDGIVTTSSWKPFVERRIREWSDVTFLSVYPCYRSIWSLTCIVSTAKV